MFQVRGVSTTVFVRNVGLSACAERSVCVCVSEVGFLLAVEELIFDGSQDMQGTLSRGKNSPDKLEDSEASADDLNSKTHPVDSETHEW
jgi:hypothetical protein